MRRLSRGFTLMELLVVLLIIGILSTVAIRTIDATRDRSLFDQTANELDVLVKAMTGDPTLVTDGRRVDFGFFGDLGRLPNDLRELVRSTDPRWRGPYLRVAAAGDTAGYLYDAWGGDYGYDPNTGTITSLGNGKYAMTVRVADSLPFLIRNSVSGNVIDVEGNPPGDKASAMSVRFYASSGQTYTTPVDEGGYYRFPHVPAETIRVGTHRMVAMLSTADSIVRWVTVGPRSNPVVDFRFGKLFRNRLVLVGQPTLMGDSAGFRFSAVNEGVTPDTLYWFRFAGIEPWDDSTYLMISEIHSTQPPHRDSFDVGRGLYDTAAISPFFVVPPNRSDVVTFLLGSFYKMPDYSVGVQTVEERRFVLRFSDGSEITVTTPQAP